MKKNYFIGIDVSKRTLDFCILSDGKILKEENIANHPAAIKLFLQELVAEYSLQRANCILCAEYTGHYTYPLTYTAESENLPLWLKNPSQIKYSSGITRGKND
nr:transposase [uncultured Bacteroides sp.]